MTDYLVGSRFPLPDDWSPEGFICVKIVIPDDPQYMATLTGLVDELRKSKSFARDATGTGAAIVSRTWDRALNQSPIESEDCEVVELRVNPETCQLEVNCSEDPEDPDWKQIITELTDPRTDIAYPPPFPGPPPEGQTNQCLAAANVAEWVWFACGAFAAELDAGGLFAAFLTQVMGIIGGILTLAVDLILDDTLTIFTEVDHETILADFGALDKQEFIDTIVCHINSDGTFIGNEWGDFLSELVAKQASNPAWGLVHYVCLLMGWGGVSIAAKVGGITEADCEPCDGWCHDYDFTEMAGTGSLNTCNLVSAGALGLHWVDLNECEGTNPQIFTDIWPELAYITSIHIEGNRGGNECDTYEFRLHLEIDDESNMVAELLTGYSAPASATLTPNASGNRIVGYLWPYFGNHCNDMYITRFQICGAGYEPPY